MPTFAEFDYYCEENDPLFDTSDQSTSCRYDATAGILSIGPWDGPRFAITSWERGFEFYCYDENLAMLKPCDTCDPPLSIMLDGEYPDLDYTVSEFLHEIPYEFRSAVQQFKCRRAPLLKLLEMEPRALELVVSNPALAAVLVNRVRYGKLNFVEAAALTKKRRREIAGACGCEPSERAVRFLGKIRETGWEESDISIFSKLAANPDMITTLSFLPVLPLFLLRMIEKWPSLVHCAFFRKDQAFIKQLQDLAGNEYLENLYAMRCDLLRIARYIEYADIDSRLQRINAASSIKKLHDSCVQKLNYCLRDTRERERLESLYESMILPEPIIPGNDTIVPIETLNQLFEEGQLMNNCVASYAEDLKHGGCTIYRVLQPERCTLLLEHDESGSVEIGEIELAHNIPPAPKTIALVNEWIDEHRRLLIKMAQEALEAIDREVN
jgi:hypothetical protein